jgi:hypothetical protein
MIRGVCVWHFLYLFIHDIIVVGMRYFGEREYMGVAMPRIVPNQSKECNKKYDAVHM